MSTAANPQPRVGSSPSCATDSPSPVCSSRAREEPKHARDRRGKLGASGKFHDTVTDFGAEIDRSRQPQNADLQAVREWLQVALDVHTEPACRYDPIQEAKRKASPEKGDG